MRQTVLLRVVLITVLLACSPLKAGEEPTDPAIRMRGSLTNSLTTFTTTGRGHVAFIGGSITERVGYRPLVERWLRKQFPETELQSTNAGISSTCSVLGAHRLTRDVLSKGPVDLIFVEFAVNDDQDAGYSRELAQRGMEGIVRQVRAHNPSADIVIIHFVNPPMLEAERQGTARVSRPAHESVAEHYGISSIDLVEAVADRIDRSTLTWKEYGGTHPGPQGNRLAADLVAELLGKAWNDGAERASVTPHPAIVNSLTTDPFDEGRLSVPKIYGLPDGWTYGVPEWKSIPGALRSRFAGRELFTSTTPGSTITASFSGTSLGLYVLAGPDAGRLEISVDEGPWKTVELYHRHSRGLHYPRAVLVADGLKEKIHAVRLRVAAENAEQSKGTAVRILGLLTN